MLPFLVLAAALQADLPPAAVRDERLASARSFVESLAPLGLRAAVVVEQGGAEVLAFGAGSIAPPASDGSTPPITADTLFNLGSNSKCYTAAATLLLVDRGDWELDDTLAELLPPLPGGVLADKRPITLRQLLTHSAGLDHSGYFRGDDEPVERDEALRRILARPLLFAPGRDSAYSDAGYLLLAALIETKAGVPFREFLEHELFEPLGLARTGFFGADPRLAALPDRDFASGRIDDAERGSGRQLAPPTWALLGAGGMVASARDVATFLRAVHAGDLFSDELVRAYESGQFRLGPQQSEGFGFVVATLGERTIRQSAGGTPQLGHNAVVSWSQPDDCLMVVHSSDAGWRAEDLAPKLRALLDGREVARPPKLAPRSAEELSRMAGRFALEAGGHLELTAVREALELAPRDAAGFAALFGAGGPELAAAKLGLARLFDQRVDPGVEAWRSKRAEELGAEQGHELLGMATIAGGSEPWAIARIHFERGSRVARFVFGPRGSMEAVVLNGELPTLRLWPAADGRLVPYSLGTAPACTVALPERADAAPCRALALEFADGRKLRAIREE